MKIKSIVKNELIQDEFQVWRLKEHNRFPYSDGASSEKYLRKVFRDAKDLSSRSSELGNYIKDWTSEYYLSKKRSQLLSGFSFDRSAKVLEVGCGCGAITRFLGETFDQVVSVEGSINRARLARQRTKDLDSVSIICSPFQEINFSQKFDIIFCVGVFEYSASFIKGEDPYDAALQYFSSILSPGGMVVIAIENQFGLKYFNGSHEDHLGLPFEGIEGYHRKPGKARTFGKVELENRLRKYFSEVEFYYPFPDYKVPDCVVSDAFLSSGRAGELITLMPSRDEAGPQRFLWDEASTILELDRNKILGFFSNSFLVFASLSKTDKKIFNQEAIFYSDGRKPEYSTESRVIKDPNGELRVVKHWEAESDAQSQSLLQMVKVESFWIDSQSLQTQVLLRAKTQNLPLDKIFEPCKGWVEFLMEKSSLKDGVAYLDGQYVDAMWSNTYCIDNKWTLIDQEWVWHEKIPTSVIIIRAIYNFLTRIEKNEIYVSAFSTRDGKNLIKEIAKELGFQLAEKDFKAFINLEGQIARIVAQSGNPNYAFYLHLRWFLFDKKSLYLTRKIQRKLRNLKSKIMTRFMNAFLKLGFIND